MNHAEIRKDYVKRAHLRKNIRLKQNTETILKNIGYKEDFIEGMVGDGEIKYDDTTKRYSAVRPKERHKIIRFWRRNLL